MSVPDRPMLRVRRPGLWRRFVARAGWRLNLALLLLTFLTATLAATVFWEDVFSDWYVARFGPGHATQGLVDELHLWARYLGEVMTHPQMLLPGLPFSLLVLLILGCHELGHYLACRVYGVPASLPYFIPAPTPVGTVGALIRIRGLIPHRRALFDIGIAGPIAGFAVTVPVLILGLSRAQVVPAGMDRPGETLVFGDALLSRLLGDWLLPHAEGAALHVGSVYVAGWLGMLLTALNLFPVGQLDGGHVVYALSRRWHRLLSLATVGGMLGLVGWSVMGSLTRGGEISPWIVWTIVLLLLRDRHPPVLDEAVPLGTGRRVLALLALAIFALCFMLEPVGVR